MNLYSICRSDAAPVHLSEQWPNPRPLDNYRVFRGVCDQSPAQYTAPVDAEGQPTLTPEEVAAEVQALINAGEPGPFVLDRSQALALVALNEPTNP